MWILHTYKETVSSGTLMYEYNPHLVGSINNTLFLQDYAKWIL